MGEEKKDEGVGDPIKKLLEEALEKQRNAMRDNFAQILQWIPTCGASTSNNHSRGATPFKVQVNFDIPIFDSQIDADVVDRWLMMVESQQKVFRELKHHLFSAPVLTLPNLQQPFEIETDASDYAIGVILTQQRHPVAYHSSRLSDTV